MGTEIGRTFAEIKILYIRKLPVVKGLSFFQPYIDLVDEIIKLKQKGLDSSIIENHLNIAIYKLYKISYENILVIDNKIDLSEHHYNCFNVKVI